MTHETFARIAASVAVLLATAACIKAQSVAAPTRLGDYLLFAGDSVTLKTTSDGRHVFVQGYFGDKGPFNIIVDTGAGPNVIDQALAEEMGLEKVGEREVLSGGVEPVNAELVVLPRMSVDGLTIENAEFITLPLGEMSMGQFHGVLGMELFREALLAFDPKNGRIAVSTGQLEAGSPGAIPFSTAQRSAFLIEISVAGKQVPMVFDTGAPSGFTFPLAQSESLPLQGALQEGATARLVGGDRSVWVGEVNGDIRLGELVYQNPAVSFIDPSAPHGSIGNAILGELVLSIDQKNGLLALRRSEAPEVITVVATNDSGEPRRLGVQLRGMGGGALTVSWVEPGSLGEQAGFKAGDTLLSVNERPAQEYDMSDLGSLFRGTEALRFEVDRNGEPRIIEVQ